MASRIIQVMQYGWKHSAQIASQHKENKIKRFCIFVDIMRCFQKYRMWSNQYLKEDFFYKESNERLRIGKKYLEQGLIRDEWQDRFQTDKKIYAKYGAAKYEVGNKRRKKRTQVYKKQYNAGEGFFVENDVQLCQQHYLNGSITIGKHVLIAKHVFIDYSGEVIIKNNVKIAAGVSIESHHRDLEAYNNGKDVNIGTKLVIEDGAYIGTHAIILDSCNYIGKYARIGAGAVVVKDIPDYSVAVGVPAKVVKTIEH